MALAILATITLAATVSLSAAGSALGASSSGAPHSASPRGGSQPLIVKRRRRNHHHKHHRRVGHDSRAGRRSGLSRANSGSSKQPPTITRQPSNASVAAGQLASFSAAASGTPTPSAQWQLSPNRGRTWSDIAGANSSSYSFVASAGENGFWYRVMYINSLGRAYTVAGTLTVGAGTAAAPVVTTQPANATVSRNKVVAFTAVATGYPAPDVQWQSSSDGGSSWSDIAGATSGSYQFIAERADDGEEYRAVFTNASGSAASDGATLTVTNGVISTTGAPAITTDPLGETTAAGAQASFVAAASGNPTPTVQWQVSTNGGTAWSNASGSSASSPTYSFTAAQSQSGYAYRAVFTNSRGSAYTTAATLTVADQSDNWSGYAITGGTFTSVSADWTVPAISCAASSTTYSSQWIGIDGDGSDTVEQDGTEADCDAGTPYYGAWYEMYGDPAVNGGYEVPLDDGEHTVQPGDAISASVGISGTTWTLAIADSTQGWSFSTNIASPSPAPEQSSAEWIGERPEVCSTTCGLAALSDFGSLTFTNATASDAAHANAPISDFSYEPLEMVGSTLLAAPGPLSAGGEQFTDTWDASGP